MATAFEVTPDIPTAGDWRERYSHLPFDQATWEQLFSRYAEKHRHYHTLTHISDCLLQLEQRLPGDSALQAAIWFHDAIYKPLSSRNEEESAELFATLVQAPENFNQEEFQHWKTWVFQLILATKHGANLVKRRELDELRRQQHDLLLDIDLSILASPMESFQRYEKQIRLEYRWVPWFLYRKKRREILQHFLDEALQQRLFLSDQYQGLHPVAVENLQRQLQT